MKQLKKDEDRQINLVKSYFSKNELKILDLKRGNLKRSRYLRECSLNQIAPVRIDNELLRQLSRVGSNLNQIAHHANAKKELDFAILEELKNIKKMMSDVLENIEKSAKEKSEK